MIWIHANFWQHVQILQPIEAASAEEAIKLFKEATASARDVVIEGVSEDPEELIGPSYGDQMITDPTETSEPTKH